MSSNVIPLPPRPAEPPATRPTETNNPPAPVVPITHVAVYTVAEVAHQLALSLGSTYTLLRRGQIPAKKIGGKWVIPKRRFHTWLDNLPETRPQDTGRELDHSS